MSGECINNEDLHWFAVRYRLGELSEQERARFEWELGENQAAREALAKAVALEAAVTICFQKTSLPVRNAVSFRWAGFATAVAVAVCFAMLIPFFKFDPQKSRQVGEREATPRLHALAFAWTEAGAEMADASFNADGLSWGIDLHWEVDGADSSADVFSADAANETLSGAAFVEEERAGDYAALEEAAGDAGWMLVALSGMQTLANSETSGSETPGDESP